MPIKKNKHNARFPPARIKKIMQSDEEIGKVAAAVPVVISKSLEMFMETLVKKTYDITMKRGAKTLTPSHIKLCVGSENRFDFLKDLVATIPDLLGDRDDQPSTPTSAMTTASFSGTKSEKVTEKQEAKISKKEGRKLPRQISTVKRTRGRKSRVTSLRTNKPAKETKKSQASSSEVTSLSKDDATLTTGVSSALKSKRGRKKKRQIIFDDDDEDEPLKKSSKVSLTSAKYGTVSTNGTDTKLTTSSVRLKNVQSVQEVKTSETENVTATFISSTATTTPAATSTAAADSQSVNDPVKSTPITEPPKLETAPPPKPFRPNHIPAQIVSASAMATAKPTMYQRRVAFKSRSENLQSGGINFTLSYTLPVKDQKSSSGSSTPGFPSLAKSDQPATPSQPTVSPSAAPWSSQGGIDEDYDA